MTCICVRKNDKFKIQQLFNLPCYQNQIVDQVLLGTDNPINIENIG